MLSNRTVLVGYALNSAAYPYWLLPGYLTNTIVMSAMVSGFSGFGGLISRKLILMVSDSFFNCAFATRVMFLLYATVVMVVQSPREQASNVTGSLRK